MLTAGLFLLAASVNLSGTWKLNIGESDWGKRKPPKSVILTIEHNEPSIRAHGVVVEDDERSNDFRFEGKLDGSEAASEQGHRTIRRVDGRTFESTWKSGDGRYIEQSKTTVSKDGRRLTREIELTRPDGRWKWTEVYDKQ
jgi:hypothetical protein